eukprot:142492-Amphidinium_carterae.1
MASPAGSVASLASTVDLMVTPAVTPFQTAAQVPLQSMNLSELTHETDQPMSTAMEMSVDEDRANPDNPTPQLTSASASEIGTTVVGMGPVGTQI